MKTINYIFLFVSLSFLAQAQTIRRVTNDPNIPLGTNMYRTLQAAHDAATANDIIYVQSSYKGASYGDATITKKLHIIGNGYSIEENKDLLGANAPYNTGSSVLGDVNLNFGTGTIIEGVQLNILNARVQVIVRRCQINYLTLHRVSNTQTASNSIVSHSNINQSLLLTNYFDDTPLSNITITNNILFNVYGTPNYDYRVSNVVFRNNYIYGGITDITNIQLQSNILYTTINNVKYTQNCPNKVGSNNVCITHPCDVGSNNVNGPLEIALFGYANGGIPNLPRHHILSIDSPAKGAGLGGVDAGPFGTADPFRLSGLPAIPQITSYSSQISNSIYTSSTPMNVTISVKGNN